MPVVELSVRETRTVALRRAPAPAVTISERRVFTRARVGDTLDFLPAVVDTGAPLTFVQYNIWSDRHKRGQVDWEGGNPNTPVAKLPRVPLLGTELPYRLARVQLYVASNEREGPVIDLGSMLVHCLERDPAITNSDAFLGHKIGACVLFGMNELFNSRTLLVQASPDGAKWTAALMQP